VPLSKTSSFTAYHSEAFEDDDHERLAKAFRVLTVKGIRAVLSNSNTPLTRRLYPSADYSVEHPLVARAINSKSSLRGEVKELLVSNGAQVEASTRRRKR
jgi:DNA adenine methylase